MDLESILKSLGRKSECTLDGTPVTSPSQGTLRTHTFIHSLQTRCNLESTNGMLEKGKESREPGGNLCRPREDMKFHTDSNMSLGLNGWPWICDVALQPTEPPWQSCKSPQFIWRFTKVWVKDADSCHSFSYDLIQPLLKVLPTTGSCSSVLHLRSNMVNSQTIYLVPTIEL